ncbi:hypothetical protein ACFQZT_26605 [Paenibacillus sp. GCM10027628]|uniref:hypothetical protein n=1 Tax=Paenibacillus sp. GCM10027628 TaxID=3273413 RepID=UPI0036439009
MAKRERLLVWYDFNEPSIAPFTGTTSLGQSLPFTLPANTEVEMAVITLNHIKADDRVNLSATVCWNADGDATSLVGFRIRRIGSPVFFETRDTSFSSSGDTTTSMNHAETGVTGGSATYVLTATSFPSRGNVQIIGPIFFDGSVIDDNPGV